MEKKKKKKTKRRAKTLKKQKAKSDADNLLREAQLRDEDVQRQARQLVERSGRGPQALQMPFRPFVALG